MKETILLAIITALVGTAQPAQAQNAQQIQDMPKKAMEQTMSQERSRILLQEETASQRFQNCMNTSNCTIQQRFQILLDLEEELHQASLDINDNCRMTNYQNCIAPQTAAQKKWQSTYENIGVLMATIDPDFEIRQTAKSSKMEKMGQSMSETEPAAGEATMEDAESMEYIENREMRKQPNQNDQSWWDKLWNGEENNTNDDY